VVSVTDPYGRILGFLDRSFTNSKKKGLNQKDPTRPTLLHLATQKHSDHCLQLTKVCFFQSQLDQI
jgi:hypothetical protein